jgi:Kef-type K+ transport system membrane component KefB
MQLLTILFLLLAAAYIAGELARMIRLPRVLGPLCVGLALAIPQAQRGIFDAEALSFLSNFADLGLMFLMFYVGLEIDFRSMMRDAKRGVYVSVFNILIPFGATFIVARLLGFGNLVAIITGLIVCVTAEAMSIEILKEMNMLKSRIGETIIMAATFDDLVEVLFISGLVGYIAKVQNPDQGIIFIIFNILIFCTVVYTVGFVILPYLLKYMGNQRSQLFIVGTLMVLLTTVIADALDFGPLIGAFLAGIIVKYTLLDAHEYREQREMKDMFEAATFGFLAPFFFIWIGLNTNLLAILSNPLLGIILTVLAFGTKILGSVIGTLLSKGRAGEGVIIGIATSNKGIVEVVAAEIARSAGIITAEFFAAIIFMTIVTTVVSPILFSRLIQRNPKHKETANIS